MSLFNRVNSNHMNRSCPNSARCSIDLHSSEINSPKIQLQGITQNDIVRLPIAKHFPKAGGGKIFKGGLHDLVGGTFVNTNFAVGNEVKC